MSRQRFRSWLRGSWLTVWFWGFLGSLAAEFLKWYNLRTSLSFPAYLRSPLYWLLTVLMTVVGGILATLYVDDVSEGRERLLAFHIGVSAPLILALLVQGVPGAVEQAVIPPAAAEKVIVATREDEAIATLLEPELDALERCISEGERCEPASIERLVTIIERDPDLSSQLQPELDSLERYVDKMERPGVLPFLAGKRLQ
jgi:hypothetical protein